jgi:two-component system response regulator YesN
MPAWRIGDMEKRRVLVVEDDAVSRRAWEEMFGRRGWEVHLAGTVAEGLDLLNPAPDFLILDLRLPDGSGESILQKIREEGLTTRVAVTTGTDDAHQMRLIENLHPESLLQKPVNVAVLWQEAG